MATEEINPQTETLKPPNPKPSTTTTTDIESDDDAPSLSPFALEALRQFLAEQVNPPPHITAAEEQEQEEKDNETVSLLTEDWRLSQFWYSPDTANTVANEVFSLISSQFECVDSTFVACIACPTLFAYLKKKYPDVSAQLLEYDKRFEQYGSDFTLYDYNQPEKLPQTMKHAYQIVVADPPYLSEECLEKVSQTIAFLRRPGKFFLLLLTGEVQRDKAAKLLGLHPCGFRPQHSSKLGNDFRLFTNYDPGDRLGGWELEG